MIMSCKICGSKTEKIFTHLVLGKHQKPYYFCPTCHFISPADLDWLEKAYKESIVVSDTGLVSRNLYLSQVVAVLLCFLFKRDGLFLDYAGGFGLFTRLMRDIGYDFYHHDSFTTNLLAPGFGYQPENSQPIEAVTAFECLEHFLNPIEEIQKILEYSKNIIFSTILLPIPPPQPKEWDYYGFEHGQHIAFYSRNTLNFIAEQFGLHFYTFNNVHLFTPLSIPKAYYRLLIKLSHRGLFILIKKILHSKTESDHLSLKNPK
jgi:hypothetical protein